MLDPNIRFTQPNMSRFVENNEERFYNLCYGASSFSNTLVIKNATGDVLGTYMTNVSLDSPILALIYNGVYFWSLQSVFTVAGAHQGATVRKWVIEDDRLKQLQSKTFWDGTDPYNLTTISCEYYWMQIINSINFGMTQVYFRYPEDLPAIKRISSGDVVRIGPNNLQQYYYGTVDYTDYLEHPTNGYCSIIFSNAVIDSFQVGNSAFCETNIWAFNNTSTRGKLHRINSTSLNLDETWTSGVFKNVESSVFNIVQYIPRINLGARTLCLFFKINHIVSIIDINDPTLIQMTMVLPDNHKDFNSSIPSYGLYLRHNPDDDEDNPELYSLQKEYRDSSGYLSFGGTYNYVTFKVDFYTAFMNITMEPGLLSVSGIADMRCQLLDQYNFPILAGMYVHWSTDGDGVFLGWPGEPDIDDIPTDTNGTSYNKFRAGISANYDNIITSTIVT